MESKPHSRRAILQSLGVSSLHQVHQGHGDAGGGAGRPGSTEAQVVASQIANVAHPDRPRFQDFGDMMLRGNRGMGYVRLDWFTPDGLGTWGDGRLFVLGTEGYIELRKYANVAVAKSAARENRPQSG
jgi:hypothetical protein